MLAQSTAEMSIPSRCMMKQSLSLDRHKAGSAKSIIMKNAAEKLPPISHAKEKPTTRYSKDPPLEEETRKSSRKVVDLMMRELMGSTDWFIPLLY
jgi:hypothetical protein